MESGSAVVTQTIMQLAAQVMPALSALGPKHSDIVSYDNMGSIFSPTLWRYKGSPLNASAGWNTARASVFARYCGQWANKLRCEWSYTFVEAGYVQTDIKPAFVSGSVNGYITPPVLSALPASGTRKLYGTAAMNGANAAANYLADPDLQRLLGPSAIVLTVPNMGGVADQAAAVTNGAAAPFQGVLHDTTFELASSLFYYGSFAPELEAGFVPAGQSAGFGYTAYLKGVYANQATYDAARDIGAVPYYAEYRDHLTRACLRYLTTQCLPRCRDFGLSLAVNAYNSLPTEHSSSGILALMQVDYGVSELLPFQWAYTTAANSKTDRLYAEDFAVPARWRSTIACAAYIMMSAAGVGKRNAVAYHPPVEWIPQPTSALGPPPTTAWTLGDKVRTQQRVLAATALACGNSPVVPLGVYDIAEAYPTQFTSFTGYTGVNKLLWSGPVDDYKDFFQWVGQSAHLLDDFCAAPAVLLVEPMLSVVVTGASYGASQLYSRVTTAIEPIMTARVPVSVAIVGGALSARAISNYDTTKVRLVVKMASDATYTANNSAIPTGANVTDLATFLAGDLTRYAPVSVTGERDGANYPLHVNPRVRSDGQAMVLHCINTDACDFAAGGGSHHESGKPLGAYRAARAGLVVTLKPWAWLANKRPRVTWWSPEAAMQGNALSALVTSSGLEIRLPALLEYGVVLLEFA